MTTTINVITNIWPHGCNLPLEHANEAKCRPDRRGNIINIVVFARWEGEIADSYYRIK
jgi:hypothetical protein